jgi:hypothetical protein
MDVSSSVIESNGNQSLLTHDEFSTRLGEIVKQWKNHHDEGLEIRHKTGKLFNDRFGDPTMRQNHGENTLKEAAEQLQIAESEISRMRRFAHHFESIADLKSRHPEVQNWTAVKELLPTLMSKDQKQKKESSDSAASRTKPTRGNSEQVGQVKQVLIQLSSTVRKVKCDLNAAERRVLEKKFQELYKLVGDRLKIKVSVVEVSAEVTLPANEVSAEAPPSASEESREETSSAA